MKIRKSSLLQRMTAVLLSAVLVVSMMSNEASMIVLAQENTESPTPDGQLEITEENTADTVEGDTKTEEETEPNASFIAAFAPLEEEIKAQTVPVGTALEELSLPGELTVYLTEGDAEEKNEDDAAEEKDEDADAAGEKNEDADAAGEKDEDTDAAGEKNEDADAAGEKNEDADAAEEEDEGEGEIGSDNSQEGTEQEDDDAENGGNEEEPDAGTDETGLTQETFTVALPEYHAENVLTVQTLEQKESVTISGVTWQSEPEYDGETEGLYLFTAVLPDGYAPADGVELPDIAVTVEGDIGVIKKTAVMRQAAATHKHPVCGANCGHSDTTHQDVEWTPLTQDSITANAGNDSRGDYYKLVSGNYYLTEDISIDRILRCDGEVSLCFNGHKITSKLRGTSTENSSLQAYIFNACDCGSGGGFISAGSYLLTGTGHAMLNLYGGNFVGENTVRLYTDTLTLDGATLEATGSAVNIQSLGSAFIKSGSATSSGSATVSIFTTNFTMSGGTVTNTNSSGKALSFSYNTVGTIAGGTITATGSSGKGVSIDAGGVVTLSGSPAISGGGADISVGGNSKITADNLTAQSKYSISYAYTHSNITEAAPAAFTVDAPNDYSGYFTASAALKNSGLALRQSGVSGNEQTVEIYRPHKLTYYAEVPATCTADGTGEYWKCTNKNCGKLFSDADGKTEITSIPVNGALGHNKEGNIAHKDPTCTEAGVQGGIYCTRCEEGKAEAETVISATGHNYRWTITKTPTVTAEGTAAGVCGNDSSHKETKTLPVLTDTTVWTVGDKVEPTEDQDGSQTYTSEYGTVTVTFPSYAKIAAAAEEIVEEALAGITATNATTKESVQSAIDAALAEAKKTNADIAGVTVWIDKFIKDEASTSAAGHIEGVVFIDYCGQTAGSVNMRKPIAQLTAGKYTVAVNNGAGDGEYAAGDTVTIKADAPASGQQFDKWAVNSGNVALVDATSSTTTFTMPAGAVEVTATYKNKTGDSGGGDGSGGSGGGDSGGGDHSGGSSGGGSGSGSSDSGNHNGNGTSDSGNNNGNGGFAGGTNNNNGAGSNNNSGNDSSGADTSGTPGASGTGQPKLKQEKEGNIQKEVRVEGEETLDAVMETPLSKLADIVLTEKEKQQAAAETTIRIVLDVKDVSAAVSAADRTLVETALNSSIAKGYTLGQYLDINLYKVVGDSRTAITETDGKITVRIDVPESLRNTDSGKVRTFAVLRVHDGKAELLADQDRDADTITIETDRFSTYAVVYKDTAAGTGNPDSGDGGSIRLRAESDSGKESGGAKDNEPKTGDAAPLELYATLAMIAGLAYLLLYFADRERGMTEKRKKELVSCLAAWAKQGGRLRKYLALAAIFVLLVYYHSIGKKMCVEWKAVYGE